MSTGAVRHSNDSCIASCSQYQGDSCSDNNVNCPIAGCRSNSSQEIPSGDLRNPVSIVGGQWELPKGSKEISHREIETQMESCFRGRISIKASTPGSGEIGLY